MTRTDIFKAASIDAWKQNNINNSRMIILQQIEREKRDKATALIDALFDKLPKTDMKGLT